MKRMSRAINVVFLWGSWNETTSEHAARARNNGAWWGCVLCQWLSHFIEAEHCDKMNG